MYNYYDLDSVVADLDRREAYQAAMSDDDIADDVPDDDSVQSDTDE